MPSNGATANVVHRDLDLLLKVTQFQMLIYGKRRELAKNAHI